MVEDVNNSFEGNEFDTFFANADADLRQRRQWLDVNQTPTLPFYLEFPDGRRGEAKNPLFLLDLVLDPYLSDVEDVETLHLVTIQRLRDIASQVFASQGKRAVVYDAMGPVFDNTINRYPDEAKEASEVEFDNIDQPIILDGFDPWTAIASLVRAGYMDLYERVPVWTSAERDTGCASCTFNITRDEKPFCSIWDTHQLEQRNATCPFPVSKAPYLKYTLVQPDNIASSMFKEQWVPVEQRTEEYILYRQQINSEIEE